MGSNDDEAGYLFGMGEGVEHGDVSPIAVSDESNLPVIIFTQDRFQIGQVWLEIRQCIVLAGSRFPVPPTIISDHLVASLAEG